MTSCRTAPDGLRTAAAADLQPVCRFRRTVSKSHLIGPAQDGRILSAASGRLSNVGMKSDVIGSHGDHRRTDSIGPGFESDPDAAQGVLEGLGAAPVR